MKSETRSIIFCENKLLAQPCYILKDRSKLPSKLISMKQSVDHIPLLSNNGMFGKSPGSASWYCCHGNEYRLFLTKVTLLSTLLLSVCV